MSWEHLSALMYLLDPLAQMGPQAAHFLHRYQFGLMRAASSVVVAVTTGISVTTGPVSVCPLAVEAPHSLGLRHCLHRSPSTPLIESTYAQ